MADNQEALSTFLHLKCEVVHQGHAAWCPYLDVGEADLYTAGGCQSLDIGELVWQTIVFAECYQMIRIGLIAPCRLVDTSARLHRDGAKCLRLAYPQAPQHVRSHLIRAVLT